MASDDYFRQQQPRRLNEITRDNAKNSDAMCGKVMRDRVKKKRRLNTSPNPIHKGQMLYSNVLCWFRRALRDAKMFLQCLKGQMLYSNVLCWFRRTLRDAKMFLQC
ncbi:hypothetical protein VIGAN_10001400, partial [Vigna angularis var. angularis]